MMQSQKKAAPEANKNKEGRQEYDEGPSDYMEHGRGSKSRKEPKEAAISSDELGVAIEQYSKFLKSALQKRTSHLHNATSSTSGNEGKGHPDIGEEPLEAMDKLDDHISCFLRGYMDELDEEHSKFLKSALQNATKSSNGNEAKGHADISEEPLEAMDELDDHISCFLRGNRGADSVSSPSGLSTCGTMKHKKELQDRLLSFLRGYKVNGKFFYPESFKFIMDSKIGELNIFYRHIEEYDQRLAHTIKLFHKRIHRVVERVVGIFLKEELNIDCKFPSVQICNAPSSLSFFSLEEFWAQNPPAEEEQIWNSDSVLKVVKLTPAGRYPLVGILHRLFHSFAHGCTWGGDWSLGKVMLSEEWDVEIFAPYCDNFSFDGIKKDLKRCITDVLPKLKFGDQYPAFWEHMMLCLSLLENDSTLSLDKWKKGFRIIITNLFLKPPLVRSAFFDNLHEILQSLGKSALSLLVEILSSKPLQPSDGKSIYDVDCHPAIDSVIKWNKKKKLQDGIRDERRTVKKDGEENVAKENEIKGQQKKTDEKAKQ